MGNQRSAVSDPARSRVTSSVSHAMTIRVPDCQQAYETLKSRGAQFITPPYERIEDGTGEIRCFFTDPDGHLFEISESVGQ